MGYPLTDSDRDPQKVINDNRPTVTPNANGATNYDGLVQSAAGTNMGALMRDTTRQIDSAPSAGAAAYRGVSGTLAQVPAFLNDAYDTVAQHPVVRGAAQFAGDFAKEATGYTTSPGVAAPRATTPVGVNATPAGSTGPKQAGDFADNSQSPSAAAPAPQGDGLDPNKTYSMKPPDPSKGPVSAAVAGNQPGMTTEQANAYYGAQNRIAEATAQEQAQRATASGAAYQNAVYAANDKRVADQNVRNAAIGVGGNGAFNNVGNRGILGNARRNAEAAGSAEVAANKNVETAGISPNLVQNAASGADAVTKAQRSASLLPGEAGVLQAQIAEKNASAGHLNAGAGLLGAQTTEAQTVNQLKQGELQHKAYMTALEKKAAAGDQEAAKHLNTYQQVMKGEGGEATPRDALNAWSHYAGTVQSLGQTPDPIAFMRGYGLIRDPASAPHPQEGQTGMLNGQKVKIVNGKPVPVNG
jgi:hypothetical protein